MEQVFFNVPLSKLEPIFKRWIKDVHQELESDITPTPRQEILMDVQEAANFLNLSVPTIYLKCGNGTLPHSKKGKRLYFSNKELLEWVKSGRKKTNSELEAEAETYLRKNKKGLNNGR